MSKKQFKLGKEVIVNGYAHFSRDNQGIDNIRKTVTAVDTPRKKMIIIGKKTEKLCLIKAIGAEKSTVNDPDAKKVEVYLLRNPLYPMSIWALPEQMETINRIN